MIGLISGTSAENTRWLKYRTYNNNMMLCDHDYHSYSYFIATQAATVCRGSDVRVKYSKGIIVNVIDKVDTEMVNQV